MTRLLPDGIPVVTVPDGSTYAFVGAHTLIRWTDASARAAIAEALADPDQRDAVLELAAQLHAPSREPDVAFDTIARALVEGSLVAFEAPPKFIGRPILTGPRPRQPDAPPRVRPTPGVTPAWVSFELLDHDGTPLGGRTIELEHGDGASTPSHSMRSGGRRGSPPPTQEGSTSSGPSGSRPSRARHAWTGSSRSPTTSASCASQPAPDAWASTAIGASSSPRRSPRWFGSRSVRSAMPTDAYCCFRDRAQASGTRGRRSSRSHARYAKRIEKPSKKVVLREGNPLIHPDHVLALLKLRPEFL